MKLYLLIPLIFTLSLYPKELKIYYPEETGHIPDHLKKIVASPFPNCTVKHIHSEETEEVLRLCCPKCVAIDCYFKCINGEYILTSQKREDSNNREILHHIQTSDNKKVTVSGDLRETVKETLTKSTNESLEEYELFEGSSGILDRLLQSQYQQGNNANGQYTITQENPDNLSIDLVEDDHPKPKIHDTHYSANQDNTYDNYAAPTAKPSSFLGIGKASWLPSLFWTTTALTFACTYYYLFTNLTEYNRFLVREDTWSTWKRNKESYETLLQIEPKRLAHLLIEDINTVYYQEPNPVKLFLEDIAQEHEKLSHAIQVRNIAINLWLPVHDIFYTLEDRLCLLNHLRSAVHAWRAKQY